MRFVARVMLSSAPAEPRMRSRADVSRARPPTIVRSSPLPSSNLPRPADGSNARHLGRLDRRGPSARRNQGANHSLQNSQPHMQTRCAARRRGLDSSARKFRRHRRLAGRHTPCTTSESPREDLRESLVAMRWSARLRATNGREPRPAAAPIVVGRLAQRPCFSERRCPMMPSSRLRPWSRVGVTAAPSRCSGVRTRDPAPTRRRSLLSRG